MGRIGKVWEDVKEIVTYKLLISRSTVRSRDGPPLYKDLWGFS